MQTKHTKLQLDYIHIIKSNNKNKDLIIITKTEKNIKDKIKFFCSVLKYFQIAT